MYLATITDTDTPEGKLFEAYERTTSSCYVWSTIHEGNK